ncbi:MAG: transposase [Proteobacteria bacterium]|nr:transposase [Pseudomonadota bacterium]
MGAITEIFRTFGPEYLEKYPQMPRQHRKVINAIINCRSGEYGVTLYRCESCGEQHRVDRSCGNRHCPQCQYHKARQWLETQLKKSLPVKHIMLTFTLPAAIRPFCRANQQAAYRALFKASSESIKALVKDPRFIGTNLPGFTGVLHTWGRMMPYHPHIHYIVPAGGLSVDRKKWIVARNSFYLPVRALSKIYKAKFKAEMVRVDLVDQIDPSAWDIDWVVNLQAVGNPEATLTYLAPYIFRVAISDSRIRAVKGREVTFCYRKTGSRRLRTTSMEVMAFISRFLQHVLPAGFIKVRHYGFMSANCAVGICNLRRMIVACLRDLIPLLSDEPQQQDKSAWHGPYCSKCGGRLAYILSIIPGVTCRGRPI